MAETRRLKELVESTITRLVLPEGPLVVGLSGGADSAALALLCLESGRRMRALHVNHGMANARSLEEAAMSIADALAVDLEVTRISVPGGGSPEGQARRARYQAFERGLGPGESLLTGHTLDDNAETILMNLIRGSGSRGVVGIPYMRPPNIYRPSLDVSRSEAREIATLAGLGYVDDPMNEDQALTRNWLRTVIMPQLRELNPRLAEVLRRAGRVVERDAFHFDTIARSSPPVLAEGRAKHARGVLISAPRPVGDRLLMSMLEHVLGQQSVSTSRLDRIWSVVHGESVKEELGGGAVALIVGPMLVIESSGRIVEPEEEFELTPGINLVGRFQFEVRSSSDRCRVLPLSAWAAVFPSEAKLVALPDGTVKANGEPAWLPGKRRLSVAWYQPGTIGYVSVVAKEGSAWTSSH